MPRPIDDRAGFSVETAELTFLRAPGRVLTKEYRRDPAERIIKRSAPSAREFTVRRVLVNDFASFAAALSDAERRADECLIRGAPGPFFPRDGGTVMRRLHHDTGFCGPSGRYIPKEEGQRRRLQPNICWLAPFAEVPTRWVMVDIDGIEAPDGAAWIADPEAAAEWIRDNHLPAMFQDVSCWWQITASAHDPSKDGGRDLIRLRLGFWLSQALTENQLVRLFRDTPADPATFRTVQPIYVARPVFRDGIADPIPRRSGILDGLDDAVEVPELPDAPLPKRATVRGYVPGAEGEGLHECEAFEEALARVGSGAGECRKGLERAAFAYARAVGARRTDAAALANRLAEAALEHRSEAEVAGYNLDGLVPWVLGTFAEDPEPEPAPEPVLEELPSPAEASDRLRATIRRLLQQGLDYLPEPGKPVPHATVRAQAGLGKTTVTLEEIAAIAAGKTVHYYASTHDLAEEVAAKARSLGLKVQVLKGRSRPIGRDQFMCRKHEIAEAVASAGLPVWQSLCEDKMLIGSGLPHQCEHFNGCPYVRQFSDLDGRLIVMAHEWLALPRRKLPAADFNVIDERFFDKMIRGGAFALDRITRTIDPSTVAANETLDLEAHAETARRVRAAIEAGEHPRDHGVTVEALKEAGTLEGKLSAPQWITPAMPGSQQRRLASEYAAGREARALAGLYRILAATYERPGLTQRVQLTRNVKMPDGELQDRVFTKWARPVTFHGGPGLVIDASADERIINRVLPLAEFVEISTPVQARVIQVVDTVCSRRKLTESKRPLERVVALARREAAAGKKVLLVSYKPAIEAVGEIAGVDTIHFGALRGVDRFKNHDVVIIAGREQCRAVVVEGYARALFGDDEQPLDLPGEYVTTRRRFVTRDGVPRFGPLQVHPDERVQAVVEQSREQETEQAVARLRLVHRDKPTEVYLLSNMPTAIPVDEFTSWSAVLPDKVEAAAAEAGGIELLSASEMARVYQERWPTKAAAKSYLQRRRSKGIEIPNRYSRENDTLCGRVVAYRLHGQYRSGHPHRAWIPAEHCGSLFEAADALARVIGELPATIEFEDVDNHGERASDLE